MVTDMSTPLSNCPQSERGARKMDRAPRKMNRGFDGKTVGDMYKGFGVALISTILLNACYLDLDIDFDFSFKKT